jgi:Arc/MetJ-type ribon-helix-helix transcriptional regulator
MATEVTTIRLPPKDTLIIDQFVDAGEFKSRSEFMRFAIKRTICELVLKEIHEKIGTKGKPTKKEEEELLAQIDEIRRELWERHVKNIS